MNMFVVSGTDFLLPFRPNVSGIAGLMKWELFDGLF